MQIVVIRGTGKAQQKEGVEYVPLEVAALRAAQATLHEADVIVVWPDQKFFARVPDVLPAVAPGETPGVWPKDPAMLADTLRLILTDALIGVFPAAKAAAAVILVVPRDFLSWPEHIQQAAFGWCFPRLRVEAGKAGRIETVDHRAGDQAGDPFRLAFAGLPIWVKDWGTTIGFDILPPGAYSGEGDRLQYSDTMPAEELTGITPLPGTMRICPLIVDRYERAKALCVKYGRGAFVIIPEPTSLSAILDTFRQTPAESTDPALVQPSTPGKTVELQPPDTATSAETTDHPIDITLTLQRGKAHGGHPLWKLVCDPGGRVIELGEKAMLTLLALAVDAEQGRKGIDPYNPKLGKLDLTKADLVKATAGGSHGSDTGSKMAQVVNGPFRKAGIVETIIEAAPIDPASKMKRCYRIARMVRVKFPKKIPSDLPKTFNSILAQRKK